VFVKVYTKLLNLLKATSQQNENEINNRMMSIDDHSNMKLANYDNENNKYLKIKT